MHKVTFDMVEKQIEIAPGVTQLMWTFNGQVPGPILRGKLGDTFEITSAPACRAIVGFRRPTG